ncbi:Bug family tripartite tricarboxylate transporter substrate binding protein [Marinomonas posidonica]|uniref:Tripartite tricarboxylate transporter (TTT) family, substrate binding protein n=1 Tax=Marinomonas posidonica (strain CECT 7376 / NCIMB 14433 / IVIA-Po-181) TaxID=491952 RepID=F6CT27_MARPP|nr:tripartite tricarboxylate transporter substrate-binding protein [Marinomonas posidonica]AEF55085.1 tripartite tricarboxylate transporter (TTT) family, substrate binding protein [Marinomonas posidonica IVIA-Po-181]
MLKHLSLKSVLVSGAVALSMVGQAHAYEPARSAECIAPANPGGGWDFTCRSVGKVLVDQDYIKGNVQTVNMSGAGGGVAFAHTVSKRAKDDNLIVAASTATTTRLAQGQFPGMNSDQVKWVGTLGADYGIIAVGKDSKYTSLSQLIAALKQDPTSVKFAGGSASGGWDHLKVLITAQKAQVENLPKIRYLAFSGGSEALVQVVGGHVDAFTGDVSEVKGFMDSGDLRVLAVLSEQRLPAPFNKIPTAMEQGIDSVAPNWRGFYVPGKASQESYDWWVDTMNELYTTQEWKDIMTKNGLMPFHKSGAEFTQFVKNQTLDIQILSKDIGLIR